MRRAAVLTVTWALALPVAGCGPIARNELQKYQASKVQDLVTQYEGARRSGDVLDMCVKSKLVAIAYGEAGQSGDEQAWRAREAADCRLAYERLAPAAQEAAGPGISRRTR